MPKERKQPRSDRLLPPERAALGESGLATGGLAEDRRAALADDDGLGVGEDGGDGEAAGALDVHEEGAGSRHERLRRLVSMDKPISSSRLDFHQAWRAEPPTLSLCLRASAAGLGLRRSTARTWKMQPSASCHAVAFCSTGEISISPPIHLPFWPCCGPLPEPNARFEMHPCLGGPLMPTP